MVTVGVTVRRMPQRDILPIDRLAKSRAARLERRCVSMSRPARRDVDRSCCCAVVSTGATRPGDETWIDDAVLSRRETVT